MAALEAQGILEWVKTLYAELTTHSLDLRKREDAMAKRESYHVVDAKSLFDHVRSSSPSSGVEDRRAGIDLVTLKECLARTNSVMRWAPTTLMLADVLTKDAAGPADLWRGYLTSGHFGLESEEKAMATRSLAKEARKKKGEERQKKSESTAKKSQSEEGEETETRTGA